MPVTVGCYVRTSGGGRGRVVDRKTVVYTVWWLVKLSTDKGGLLWCKADHLTVIDQ